MEDLSEDYLKGYIVGQSMNDKCMSEATIKTEYNFWNKRVEFVNIPGEYSCKKSDVESVSKEWEYGFFQPHTYGINVKFMDKTTQYVHCGTEERRDVLFHDLQDSLTHTKLHAFLNVIKNKIK